MMNVCKVWKSTHLEVKSSPTIMSVQPTNISTMSVCLTTMCLQIKHSKYFCLTFTIRPTRTVLVVLQSHCLHILPSRIKRVKSKKIQKMKKKDKKQKKITKKLKKLEKKVQTN